jgi:hypothetical protein
MKIGAIKILISNCNTGIYLRWFYNGWHYFNFTNGYTIQMRTESMDTQVTRFFSRISKIERPTRLKAEYSYQITLEGIAPKDVGGFLGLLLAEKVEEWGGNRIGSVTADSTLITVDTTFITADTFIIPGIWREVEITRGDHPIRDAGAEGYYLDFEITRKELPVTSAVYQKSLKLYIGDTLCDMDDDEVVPINKQVNDIAEMQDRQSDFTATFKIRKTRAMRSLFELSGEVGASTLFPFQQNLCKLISDNIEIITNGHLFLDSVDDQYYNVAILSGNKSFFTVIDKVKITDLLLPNADHIWNYSQQRASHNLDLDYVYPLCEPSDDGGLIYPSDTGDYCELYGGRIWPFIKIKYIWDEIFKNAGFSCEGNILTDDIFLHLFMPIVNRNSNILKKWFFSMAGIGSHDFHNKYGLNRNILQGGTLIFGDNYYGAFFRDLGQYYVPYNATYTVKVTLITIGANPSVFWVEGGVEQPIPLKSHRTLLQPHAWWRDEYIYMGDITAMAPNIDTVQITDCFCYYWDLTITNIVDAKIGYGTDVTPHINLPDMTQSDFIKLICQMFALIPEVNTRDHIVKFWNYSELYDNISNARDWSAYLSERDDEMEFKFGEYAQNNYLRYTDSDDVIKDNGKGNMLVDDATLELEKDMVEVPISTCDWITILNNIFPVNVSRINFNKFNADTGLYDMNDEIDARIVYVDHTKSDWSPPYHKTFGISAIDPPNPIFTHIITDPKFASSIEVSFPYLVTYYASLSRLLTHTNLRRAKFNLPVYEVAGLKHYIPIYLNQYKAYFYVNKINNYVPGKLCTIDLIKL